EHCNRRAGVSEIETLEQRLDLRRHRGAVDVLAIEREGGRDHRYVAQRQDRERGDVNGAAAHLRGVLRGADHGGTDAFARALDLCPPALRASANLLREQTAEIAVRPTLPPIYDF